jgi:hypothetical protein
VAASRLLHKIQKRGSPPISNLVKQDAIVELGQPEPMRLEPGRKPWQSEFTFVWIRFSQGTKKCRAFILVSCVSLRQREANCALREVRVKEV